MVTASKKQLKPARPPQAAGSTSHLKEGTESSRLRRSRERRQALLATEASLNAGGEWST